MENKNYINAKEDVELLLDYVEKFSFKFKIDFNLIKIIKCLELCKKIDDCKKNHKHNLIYSFFVLSRGLLTNRDEKNINFLKEILDYNTILINNNNSLIKNEISNYYEIKENKIISKEIGLSIYSQNISQFPEGYCLTPKFIELLEVIYLGLSTYTPVFLEGEEEQGKSAAINYLNKVLGFEIIIFNISKNTKVEDLLFRTIIENSCGEIEIKQEKTELIKTWENNQLNPNKIIVIQNINEASPGVVEILSSLFSEKGKSILLPDGSISYKGIVNLIGIFNPKNGSSKDKLPSSIINNSIYHYVESPDENDIAKITQTLFKFYKLNEDELYSFNNKFKQAREFCMELQNETIFTLSDIKKYLQLRQNNPNINKSIIEKFIFVYKFIQKENIDKMNQLLNLMQMNIDPKIEYENNKKKLIFYLYKGSEDNIKINTYQNDKIIDEEIIKRKFNYLTLDEKNCILFLLCSVITIRACILLGDTGSGK